MVVCNDGFKSSGSSVFLISCLSTRQWSNFSNCEREVLNLCPDPPAYRNAVVSPGSNEAGSQRMVVCNDGFKISGSTIAFIYCLRSTLQWTEVGNCERPAILTRPTTATPFFECPDPPYFSNAYVSHGGNQIGSRRVVICNEGFRNDGTLTIFCQSNLRWSTPGTCFPSLFLKIQI